MSAGTYAEQALDMHPWPAATIGLNGRFTFANAAFARWLHVHRGDSLEQAFHDQPHLLDGIRAQLAGQGPQTLRAVNEQEGVTYKIRLTQIPPASTGFSALALYAEPVKSDADLARAQRRDVLDKALDEISRIPFSSPDPKVTLDRTVKTIVSSGVADSAVVYVYHDGQWAVRHAAGRLEALICREMSEKQVRPSLKALRESRVIVINDPSSADKDTRWWLTQCGVCAMMDVNIDVPWGDLVDFAVHYHAPPERKFSDDDKVFLGRVASRITMALHNVGLLDQVRKEQCELDTILENIPVGVFMLDADLKLVRANPSFGELFGVDIKQARGKPIWKFIPRPLGERMHRHSRQALKSAGPLQFQELLPLSGGGFRTFETRKVAIRDNEGQPYGVVAIAVDIQERKEAEAERQRLLGDVQIERDRLSSLVAAISDEVWFADTQRQFTLANPAARKAFGMAAATTIDVEKLAGSLEVLRPDGRPRPPEESPALRALNGDILVNEEEIIRMPASGELRYREVSATPVKDEVGQIIGAVAVVRDITERKRLEEDIRRMNVLLERKVAERTEELRRTIAELERFVYTVAHDLRAPLRGIHRYSELLLEQRTQLQEDEIRNGLRRVAVAAKRMDKLISDLLTYSRVGLMQPKEEVLDVAQIVKETLGTLATQIGNGAADVKVSGPFPPALGDHVLLGQVLENLLDNALKFVPPDRTPKVEIGAMMRDRYTRLWIQDNGIGLESQHGERVFRLFERLHADDEYNGTGVGLAIVQRAVERMGGHVGFESEPGKGSRFWVELKSAEI